MIAIAVGLAPIEPKALCDEFFHFPVQSLVPPEELGTSLVFAPVREPPADDLRR
jgi:hypothetical protein